MVELKSQVVTAQREADEVQDALKETRERLGKWRAYAKRLEAVEAARKERARLRAEQRKAAPVRYCYYWCSNPECGSAVRYIFHKDDPRFSNPAGLADRCEACEGVLIWVAAAENVDEVEEIAREARAYVSMILEAPDDIDAYLDAIMCSDTWRAGGPAQQHLSDLSNRFYNAHDADTGNEFLVRSTTRDLRRVLLRLILSGAILDGEQETPSNQPSKAPPARVA